MTEKQKRLRRIRDITEHLEADLGWIDPQRRRVFCAGLVRERNAHLNDLLREEPEKPDLEHARPILEHLRADPEAAELAEGLARWIARAT